MSESKLRQIKQNSHQTDWGSALESNSVDKNFESLLTTIHSTMDKYSPLKQIKISAKRRYIEPWMTKTLETSSIKKKKLFKESLKATSNKQHREIYVQYRNHYNSLK